MTTIMLELSDQTLDRIAERVAAKIAAQAKPATYVDMAEAQTRLSVTDRQIRRMVAAGRLEASHVGRRVLIAVASIDRVLREGRR